MKTLEVMVLLIMSMTGVTNSFAQGGDKVGGGGDASEMRVNEIRADILSWIHMGGSRSLKFENGLSNEAYIQAMEEILQPKAVIIGFVEKDDNKDEELQVAVQGVPKTCRGFLSRLTNSPTILCSIGRFRTTSESDQYKLIHHEYAGLAMVESNKGASSDYGLSNQITGFLKPQTVLKLGLKNNSQLKPTLYGKVEKMFESAVVPNPDSIANILYSGRCFSEKSQDHPTNAAYFFEVLASKAGPLDEKKFQASSWEKKDENEDYFDNYSLKKEGSFYWFSKGQEFGMYNPDFGNSKVGTYEISTYLHTGISSKVRAFEKYLVEKVVGGDEIIFCYYFIPKLKH